MGLEWQSETFKKAFSSPEDIKAKLAQKKKSVSQKQENNFETKEISCKCLKCGYISKSKKEIKRHIKEEHSKGRFERL